jgi:hypothetical protein
MYEIESNLGTDYPDSKEELKEMIRSVKASGAEWVRAYKNGREVYYWERNF